MKNNISKNEIIFLRITTILMKIMMSRIFQRILREIIVSRGRRRRNKMGIEVKVSI